MTLPPLVPCSALALLMSASAALSAEPAALIPREVLFGNPVKSSPKISPDGTRIAYLAPSPKGVLNLWLKTLGKEDDAQVSDDTLRGIRMHEWAEDGAHLLYLQDVGGDENFHVYSVDLASKVVRDLTPFQGIRVLQVNFRASTGFGKKFLNAGNGQWSGAMQDDLTDAVTWAVKGGRVDPARVCIYGGSYGGYAVLAGLTLTPDLFRCGIDLVGPSNVKTFSRPFLPTGLRS